MRDATLNEWVRQDNALYWSPDTTKTLNVTGLDPGARYIFRVQSLGVDGLARVQADTDVTALATEIGLVDTTTTIRARVEWASMYEGAKYQIKYTAIGQTTKKIGGSS